ncbi:VCBS repeat-containing protein [Nannocystis exedens]|uniref:VCBS repeat-containing protein n=1 Tax=Nannocystis exedens TaxID=54 RepID=UPI001160A61E|nr:VCBS repeat-containing protein [Nannocystis exedens]
MDRLFLADSPASSVGLDMRGGALMHLRTDEVGASPSLSWLGLNAAPRDILFEDLDGDGVHDFAVSDSHGERVVVARGGQDGALGEVREVILAGGPGALTAWYSPEGGARLLVASSHKSSLWVIEWTAEGPAVVSEVPALQPGVATMVATDLDLDGVQELVASNPAMRRIDTLSYEGGTWAVRHSTAMSLAVSRLQLGRFDDDAYADLLLVDDATGTAHVFRGLAGGAFSTPAVALDSPGRVLDAMPWARETSPERPVLLVEDFGLVEAPLDGPATVLGFTAEHASSLARPASGDGSLVVVAKDAGRVAWLLDRPDALALGDATFLQALETAYPLLAADTTESGLLDIIARHDDGLVVFPALSPDSWAARVPIDLELDAGIVAVYPARFDLDAHVDLLAVDGESRLLALTGGGDGTFVHVGTYGLWAAGAELRVGDVEGDGRDELVVTRRDVTGAPRELWRFDGVEWASQPLPGAGGRPASARSAELVFASTGADGASAFLERVVADSEGWKLGGRSELPAHVAELTAAGAEGSSDFAFCLDGSKEHLPSIGRWSSSPTDVVAVTIEPLEPTPVAHDGELGFVGGACIGLWSVRGPERHDLVAHFRFTAGIDAVDALSMFEPTADRIAHYRNEYIGKNVSTVIPLVAGEEWRGFLVKSGLFTELRPAAERPAPVARRTLSVWPEVAGVPPQVLPAPSVAGGASGVLLAGEGTSTILTAADARLDGLTVPCPAESAALVEPATALVVCDDRSLVLVAPRAAPVSLGSFAHRGDAMAAWNSPSGLFLITGDAEVREVRRYRVDPVNHTTIPIEATETAIVPRLLRIVSRSGEDTLLVADPSERSIALLSPASLGEHTAPQVMSLDGPAFLRLEVGDFDNDGSSELITLDGQMLRVLALSRPSGPPLAELALPAEGGRAGSFVVMDVDCDANLDLAVLDERSVRLLLWRGDGAGGFARDGELEFPRPVRAVWGASRCAPGVKSLVALGDSEVYWR